LAAPAEKTALPAADTDAPQTPSSAVTPQPAASAVTPARLNPEALAELQEMIDDVGADMTQELIDIFLTDTPKRLTEMEQALRDDDAVVLRRAAHSLKSNGKLFGADDFAAMCKTLEANARTAEEEGTPITAEVDRVAQVQQEYNRVQAALEQLTFDGAG